jgi:Na+/phosphate symporter
MKAQPEGAPRRTQGIFLLQISMAMAVIGGLGIFMLGMKYMSEGMQAVAGNSLRRMISLVTDNR